MARPRKVSDDDVFAAVHRVMQRVRPGDLTLAAVGAEAGVTAGALVQRFGSRQQLLRALNERFAEGTGDMLAALRRSSPTPLAAVRAYAEAFGSMAATPAQLAHHLAWLEMDLSDPAMYEQVRAHTRHTRTMLRRWVKEAIAIGELRAGVDPTGLARLVHTTVTGSMMNYAFFREGSASTWVRKDLDLALRPYLPGR
jgi:AcrR family transcriptional regulator